MPDFSIQCALPCSRSSHPLASKEVWTARITAIAVGTLLLTIGILALYGKMGGMQPKGGWACLSIGATLLITGVCLRCLQKENLIFEMSATQRENQQNQIDRWKGVLKIDTTSDNPEREADQILASFQAAPEIWNFPEEATDECLGQGMLIYYQLQKFDKIKTMVIDVLRTATQQHTNKMNATQLSSVNYFLEKLANQHTMEVYRLLQLANAADKEQQPRLLVDVICYIKKQAPGAVKIYLYAHSNPQVPSQTDHFRNGLHIISVANELYNMMYNTTTHEFQKGTFKVEIPLLKGGKKPMILHVQPNCENTCLCPNLSYFGVALYKEGLDRTPTLFAKNVLCEPDESVFKRMRAEQWLETHILPHIHGLLPSK